MSSDVTRMGLDLYICLLLFFCIWSLRVQSLKITQKPVIIVLDGCVLSPAQVCVVCFPGRQLQECVL